MTEHFSVNRVERLAAARKKLKDFQLRYHNEASPTDSVGLSFSSRQQRPLSATFSACSNESIAESSRSMDHRLLSDNFTEPNENCVPHAFPIDTNASQFSHDETRSPFERVTQKPTHHSNEEVKPVQRSTSSEEACSDYLNLRQENEQLRQYCGQVTARLEELNNNYAHLRAAYSSIMTSDSRSARNPLGTYQDTGTEENLRLRQQLQENLQTMSVIIEEKSDLQSQLRQAMDIANAKNCENEDLQRRLKETKIQLNNTQSHLNAFESAKRAVEASFEHQTEELVRVRQEWAQAQAKVSESLQDKSEAQTKLKMRLKECDSLQKALAETQRRLDASEIYVRQLTGGDASPPQTQTAHNDLNVENERLKIDLTEWRQAYDSLKWENAKSKECYEEKLFELASYNRRLTDERVTLENSLMDLREQVNVLRSKTAVEPTRADLPEDLAQTARLELENLKTQLDRIRCERDGFLAALEHKDSAIAKLEDDVVEKDRRISELNEYLDASTLNDSNTKSLLEQLHNEKATSSRSIAQNLALKTQLAELEDKFVAVTNEQMECASNFQTARHTIHSLEGQLTDKSQELEAIVESHAEECRKLKTQVNSVLRHEYDRRQLEDRLQHYEAAYKAASEESVQLKSQLEMLLTEKARREPDESVNNVEERPVDGREKSPEAYVPDAQYLLNQEARTNSDLSAVHTSSVANQCFESEQEVDALKMELQETALLMRRISAENAELHRIMDQNSVDENQNNIRVELNRAVERLGFLADENERLRRTVADLSAQTKQFAENNANDDRSSICSEHIEHRRDIVSNEAFENLRKSTEQLQQRLKRAMDQNADLADQNEHLEHLIVKLQSETETIGEYVTLYRHQRQLIRDKLKEKEQHVAHLSHENASIQAKLSELQDLVIDLMKERGTLVTYSIPRPVRQAPPRSPPSKLSPEPRGLSETLVDEVAGDVDDGACQASPSSSSVEAVGEQPSPGDDDVRNEVSDARASNAPPESAALQRSSTSADVDRYERQQSGTADRILQILAELQKPDFTKHLKPYERDLHCKHCTGRMITL